MAAADAGEVQGGGGVVADDTSRRACVVFFGTAFDVGVCGTGCSVADRMGVTDARVDKGVDGALVCEV